MQISVYAILKNKENNMSPLLKSGHIIINCNNVFKIRIGLIKSVKIRFLRNDFLGQTFINVIRTCELKWKKNGS